MVIFAQGEDGFRVGQGWLGRVAGATSGFADAENTRMYAVVVVVRF